jgi:hypothetical protein
LLVNRQRHPQTMYISYAPSLPPNPFSSTHLFEPVASDRYGLFRVQWPVNFTSPANFIPNAR